MKGDGGGKKKKKEKKRRRKERDKWMFCSRRSERYRRSVTYGHRLRVEACQQGFVQGSGLVFLVWSGNGIVCPVGTKATTRQNYGQQA